MIVSEAVHMVLKEGSTERILQWLAICVKYLIQTRPSS